MEKGFTGGEKSYQMAKEIHEILSELDGKFSKRQYSQRQFEF